MHEGLDFSDFSEAVDDHGCGWLEQRSSLRPTMVFQGIVISLFVHAAIICFFAFAPKNVVSARSPWLEVHLVSLGSGEITEASAGNGSGGGAGTPGEGASGKPPASNTVLLDSPAPEAGLASPDSGESSENREEQMTAPLPTQEIIPEANSSLSLVREAPKATADKASMRSRTSNRPKDLLAKTSDRSKTSKTDSISPSTSQPVPAPLESAAGEQGSAQGVSESEGSRTGSVQGPPGRGTGGPSSGGPVDSEFNSANGPRFAHQIMPKYPRLARELGKEAVVILRVTIDERGRPIAVEAVKSAGSGFDEEAIRAVKGSTFHPAKWEGKPVICRAILPIRFELKGSE